MNIKKGSCVKQAFENLQKVTQSQRLNEILRNIEEQAKRNRQQKEEYEKTVRLLGLMNKDRT
jgi:hypothetical protein